MKKEHTHKEQEDTHTPEAEVQTPTVEIVQEESLEQKLAASEQTVADWKAKYAYLYADFDNYRKRSAKDVQTARNDGLVKAIEPMINILDHFRMAVDASNKTDNVEKIREGLAMIFDQLGKVIKDMGIDVIEAQGTMFDHTIHEAISQQPSDLPEGTVLQQWTCGYKMGDRLIRPARVVVSAGQPTE